MFDRSGVFSILKHPLLYGQTSRRSARNRSSRFANTYVQARAGDHVLDIGRDLANYLLAHLPARRRTQGISTRRANVDVTAAVLTSACSTAFRPKHLPL
jgi:hypothetical protein